MSAIVGAIIRIERHKKQYTQFYMAFMLDISQNYYSKLERGETEITVRRLYEISKILEVSVYQLLPESDAGMSINTSFITRMVVWVKQWFRSLKYSRKKLGR